MKKNLLLLGMLVGATMIGFTACGDDDDDDLKPTNTTTVKLPEQPYKDEAIKIELKDEAIKYEVAGKEEDYHIAELELTESGYYFVKLEKNRNSEAKATRANSDDYVYIFGLYTINPDGSYNLAGFGVVNIHVNEDGSANVSFVLVNSDGRVLTTGAIVIPPITKPADNVTATATTNLCRAWDIVSTRVQIEGVSAFYQEPGCDLNSIFDYIKQYAELTDELTTNTKITKIVFDENGSSFTFIYANGKCDKATWRWEDAAEGKLLYDWDDHDMGYSFIDGTATVKFSQVGTPSQLKLFGITDNGQGERKKVTVTVNIK